jgi:hypothetical protein
MTIEERIEAALFAHTLTLALDGAPPIAWPNATFNPPAGAYIRVDHFPNANSRLLVKGSAPHLRQGILQLTVVAPLNVGPTLATGLAGAIAEHFPADLALFEEGTKVRIQAAPDVMDADKTDVSNDVPVSVRYECFG